MREKIERSLGRLQLHELRVDARVGGGVGGHAPASFPQLENTPIQPEERVRRPAGEDQEGLRPGPAQEILAAQMAGQQLEQLIERQPRDGEMVAMETETRAAPPVFLERLLETAAELLGR